MKLRLAVIAAGAPCVTLGLLAAFSSASCSSSSKSSSDADSGATASSFTYQPAGCTYAVSPPDSRAFLDLALDDATAPSDTAGAAPVRVRIGLGGGTTKGQAGYADPSTTAAFTWETSAKTTNAKVRIGADPASLTDVHAGYVFTSPPPQVGFGAAEPAVYMHEVHVCGLQAGKTYYYQVGGGASGQEIWSATQSFTTTPSSGKITVGVFGDSRDKVATWQLVHERMRDAAPTLLLVSGDIVDFGTQSSMYQQWLDAIWKDPNDATKFLTLGQITMVPVPGNHENDAAQFYGNFAIPGDGPYAEQYASFDVGSTHFTLIDDESLALDSSSDSAQKTLAWIDADLAAANADRAAHPFLVVIGHRGVFSTSKHSTDPDVLNARLLLTPKYDKYKVNLVLSGHDHEYERTEPLNAGSPASGAPVVKTALTDGTTYVVNAGAGADPYPPGASGTPYRHGDGVGFGTYSTQGYVGCYVLLTIESTKLTMSAYGMKSSGGGVAGDDPIDSVVFGQ